MPTYPPYQFSPVAATLRTIVAAVAELERSIIAERVKAGVARAREKGKRLGRPTGSKVDAAKVGRLLAEGQSYRQTAKALGCSAGTIHRLAVAFKKSPSKTRSLSTYDAKA